MPGLLQQSALWVGAGAAAALAAVLWLPWELGRRRAARTAAGRRAMLDNAQVFLGLMDLDGRVVDASRAALAFAGVALADVAGRRLGDTIWWRGNPMQAELEAALEAARRGEAASFDTVQRNAQGAPITVRFSVLPVRDGRGRVVSLLAEGMDITENRGLSLALKSSQERFAKAFQASPFLILVARLRDAEVLDVNDTFTLRTGQARAAAVGRTLPDLGLFVDPGVVPALLEGLRAGGQGVRDKETLIRAEGGQVRPVTLSVEAIELSGDACALLAMADITELKKAQAEIQLRNNELTLLNNLMSAASGTTNPAELLKAACRELGRVFGFPHTLAVILDEAKDTGLVVAESGDTPGAKALGALVFELSPFVASGGRVLACPNAQEDERLRPLWRKLKEVGARSVLALPLTVEGQPFGWLVGLDAEPREYTVRDLDQAEVAMVQVQGALTRLHLGQTRLLLMAAIEQMPSSVVITDVKGAILFVNAAFERVTGYRREEVMGGNPRILKSGKQDAAFYQAMWGTLSRGEVWTGRIVNKDKRGGLFVEDALIAPVRNNQGAIANYIAIKRDITREIEREEVYQQAQKMEGIGRLAGGVAHDFNNILTAINGFAELAQAELGEGHPALPEIRGIQESAWRAASLTRQLLSFARKQVAEVRPIQPGKVVEGLSLMLKRLIGEDIEVVLAVASGAGLVLADPGQLEQVIMNLVVNARDAMRQGGRLTIRVDARRLDATEAVRHPGAALGDYVVVRVEDTGTGISPEVAAHLFEPFFTTKEQGKGTGLGLATCYGIVQQAKGFLRFDTEPGRGSGFEVWLPRLSQGVAAPEPGEPAVALDRGNETILLCEDEDALRLVEARVLREHGYTVLESSNGVEALNLARSQSVDLLLTDVVMPTLGGFGLAEVLGQERPSIKTLFISGYTTSGENIVLAPGQGFLQKPFKLGDLLAKVRQVLDTRG